MLKMDLGASIDNIPYLCYMSAQEQEPPRDNRISLDNRETALNLSLDDEPRKKALKSPFRF